MAVSLTGSFLACCKRSSKWNMTSNKKKKVNHWESCLFEGLTNAINQLSSRRDPYPSASVYPSSSVHPQFGCLSNKCLLPFWIYSKLFVARNCLSSRISYSLGLTRERAAPLWCPINSADGRDDISVVNACQRNAMQEGVLWTAAQ